MNTIESGVFSNNHPVVCSSREQNGIIKSKKRYPVPVRSCIRHRCLWASTPLIYPKKQVSMMKRLSQELMATQSNRYEIVFNERAADLSWPLKATLYTIPNAISIMSRISLPSMRQSPYSRKRNERKSSNPMTQSNGSAAMISDCFCPSPDYLNAGASALSPHLGSGGLSVRR